MKVRCIDASACNRTLTVGKVYEVVRQVGRLGFVCYVITDDLGRYQERRVNRFEPVTDEPEAEPCLCNSDRGPRSCPEHGVRCHNPDCDKLCDGPDAWNSLDADNRIAHWCSVDCLRASRRSERPKVDPYEAHRRKSDEAEIYDDTMYIDNGSGATARLLRGLEGEKVRERVMAFPKQGRNFELKGKR